MLIALSLSLSLSNISTHKNKPKLLKFRLLSIYVFVNLLVIKDVKSYITDANIILKFNFTTYNKYKRYRLSNHYTLATKLTFFSFFYQVLQNT